MSQPLAQLQCQRFDTQQVIEFEIVGGRSAITSGQSVFRKKHLFAIEDCLP
jgi:hypothetical protein